MSSPAPDLSTTLFGPATVCMRALFAEAMSAVRQGDEAFASLVVDK